MQLPDVSTVIGGEEPDDEVIIVAVDKPWHDRSPILLTSSDSDSDNMAEIHSSNHSMTVDCQVNPCCHNDRTTLDHEHQSDIVIEPSHALTECDIVAKSDAAQRSHHKKHRHKRHQHRHHRHSGCHDDDPDAMSMSECSRHNHDRKVRSRSSGHRHRSHHRRRHRSPSVTSGGEVQKQKTTPRADDMQQQHPSATFDPVASHLRTSQKDGLHQDIFTMSDDECSDDSRVPGALRSVIVVPHVFKKHSKGHKRTKET
jgi:hypothetical protein